MNALQYFRVDDIVISTFAETKSGWLRADLIERAAALPLDPASIDALIDDAIFEAFEGLPPGKRRDPDVVSSAIERAVRNSVNAVWSKKPQVHVLVVEV